MVKLVDIFGYLSVWLRAGTLVFQSLLLGGALFIFWIARSTPEISAYTLERTRARALQMFAVAAGALSIVQALYLYVNSAVLMATAEIGLTDVSGASFFIAGCVIFSASLAAAIAARWKPNALFLSLLVSLVLAASVMTNHAASRVDGRS